MRRTGLSSQLARVRGLVGPNGQRDYGYVFVVTYGRSGSTLVQGLLNTLPGTLIRGENNLYVLGLYRAKALARSFRDKHAAGSGKPTSAFYGLDELDLGAFDRSARELVTQQLLGSADPRAFEVIGFKEVLWHRVGPKETRGFFAFLDEAFPGARYVLNQRSHAQVVGSGFWQKQDETEAMKAIARVEKIQDFLRSSRPERVFDTRYEVLAGDDQAAVDEQLHGLASFVHGSCDDALLAQLRETMRQGHGPNPFGVSRGRRERRAAAPAAAGAEGTDPAR